MDNIVLEGSVRSGKTSSASLSFVLWAMETYDGEDFAFIGKTIGVALRNVINPLKRMLRAEDAIEYVEHRSSTEGYHLDIQAFDHQNTFWVFGGRDESSQDLIQGKTLAGIFFDEVLLMPQSFVVQAQARTSVEGARCWYTLNSDTPNHWFYTETLAPMEADGTVFYLHMTFDDNPSLSERVKERYRRMWPVGSIYYRRYVLGERCAAEGAIYPFDWEPGGGPVALEVPKTFSLYEVGVDYGSRNDFHAILLGLKDGVWYALKEYVWSGRTQGGRPPSKYVQDLADLCQWVGRIVTPISIPVDPSAAGFIDEVNLAVYRAENPLYQLANVCKAKNDVGKGIENLQSMLFMDQLKISSDCPKTIASLMGYVWDEKAALRGKEQPLKTGDHGADALRYAAMNAAFYIGR